MARITVEDCLRRVDNRFELVLMATRRARQLERGAAPTVPEDGDKPAVIALREIAGKTMDAATIDAIERDYQEQEARKAIEWAATEWQNDDEIDDERESPTSGAATGVSTRPATATVIAAPRRPAPAAEDAVKSRRAA